MERTLNLLGRPVSVLDHDESRYLSMMPPEFERDALSIFAAFCSPHSTVLDIGANIGLTAIALGHLCSSGKVFAIEPSPATFNYLKQNIARSGLTNVTCANMAAAAAAGELPFTYTPAFSAGGFISQKYDVSGDPRDKYQTCTVPACPVDEYLKTVGVDKVDFMKIDVEGFELEVLRGALKTIQRDKPVVYCEVYHWCLNIFRRLPLPDFIEEVCSIFPHVLAVGSDLEYLDLSDRTSLQRFYHDHTTRCAYLNLVCGFDKAELLVRMNYVSELYQSAMTRHSLVAERDAILNSRTWRYSAPLRRLWAMRRRLRHSA